MNGRQTFTLWESFIGRQTITLCESFIGIQIKDTCQLLAQRHPDNVSNTREMVEMPNSLSRSLSISMSQSNVISKEQNTEEGTFKHPTDKLFHSSTKFLNQSPISACSNHQGSVPLDEESHQLGSEEFHSTEAFPQFILDLCEGDLQRAEAFENYLMRVCSEKSMSEENWSTLQSDMFE